MIKLKKLFALGALLLPLVALAAYPEKTIKIVVGFTPGGSADSIARILGMAMSSRMGQTVIIENRAGANGNIATEFVSRSAPDGYTLFYTSIGHAVNPALYKEAKYDPVKDFTPIGQVLSAPNVLVVPASSPFNNVKEMIAYAKANPGKLNFASSGSGASVHLSAEVFKQMAGLDLVHIPYKGTGSLLPDLLSGTVAMSFPNLPSALPFIQSGKLKALGVTTAKRSAAAPQIPTLAEAGVPGYDMSTWYGLIGPAGMPPAIITQLNHELNAILQDPVIRQKLVAQGVDPVTGSPEEFGQFIRKETRYWAELIKKAKVELN
jgi:tripartite-type tricarboxylate transporter receptor subunit TctC